MEKKLYKIKIKILKDEYWYGGLVKDGKKMPYSDSFDMVDLSRESHSNQSSSIFISTEGRYVYSSEPFKYYIKNKIICIESIHELKVKNAKENNLKSAMQVIQNKYFSSIKGSINLDIIDKPQYNTWIELGYNSTEEKVLKYVQSIVDNKFPCGLIIIDDNWQKAYGMWDFDKSRFPTPKRMIDKIHNLGFRVSLWVCPFISADSEIYRILSPKGFLIKNKEGKTKIIKWWNGYSACLDLTNPKALEWFSDTLKKLQQNYHIDAFKFDAGDAEFYDDCVSFDGKYQINQVENLIDLASQFYCSELRVAFNGQNNFVIQRLCDKNHTWKNNGINTIIPDACVASILGYKILCPDLIGGGDIVSFEKDKFDQELFVRYSQLAAFFPIMQFSKLPWNCLSKEYLSIVKESVELHQKLVPYIKELVTKAFEKGEPIIRPLEYEYPHLGYALEKEFMMLGDKYIVAPMLGKAKTHKIFRLPEGKWKNEKGVEFIGGKNVPINSSIGEIAFFEKI